MSAQLEAGNPALDAVTLEPNYTANGNINTKNESEKIASGATDTRETGLPLTLIPTKSSIRDDPPPDGGLKAWTQACAGHLVVFSTWGSISSFGVFQAYYVTALGRPPSDISWVGSVQVMLLFFIGTFSGRATDGGYYRHTFLAGSFMVVFGIMMTSISTQYWQLFLAQGICQGLGNGLLFCPMISLVSTYFHKKRAFAISLAACGGATGGMVFPAIVESLLPRIGFGWTVRVIGFVVVFNLTIVLALARTRIRPRKTGPIIEWSAFKELPYLLFSIGSFLLYLGVYFVYFYVSSHLPPSMCVQILTSHRLPPSVVTSSASVNPPPYPS
jgi:MFS family permease